MIPVLFALSGMAALLFLAEILWHRKVLSGEYARKFVHVIGGAYVAFWPYFLSFKIIQLIAVFGIVAWIVTRKMHFSYAMKDIKRISVGELLYPISVLLVAMIANQNWIFTVSILFLSVADGMAAVIGKKFGTKKMTYKVYGGKKTLQGSAAYLVCAYLALLAGLVLGGRTAMFRNPVLVFGSLPLICVFLENISPFGTDNFTVPLTVAFILNFVVTLSLLKIS